LHTLARNFSKYTTHCYTQFNSTNDKALNTATKRLTRGQPAYRLTADLPLLNQGQSRLKRLVK